MWEFTILLLVILQSSKILLLERGVNGWAFWVVHEALDVYYTVTCNVVFCCSLHCFITVDIVLEFCKIAYYIAFYNMGGITFIYLPHHFFVIEFFVH